MIKVLHVGEYVQGGVATYISTLINHPEFPDVDDYLICADKNSETKWKIPADHIQYYSYHRSLMQIPKAMFAIRKAIKQIKPDVVYCHSTWAGLFVRFPMLFLWKPCRVIYNAHGWAFLRDTAEWKRKIYAGIERILQGKTDRIINVSKYEYNAAIRYGLKKVNQTVIYSGISREKGKIDSRVKLPLGKINLLFVGRFDPQKGLDLLLKAFNSCHRQDLHLTVIGDNVVGGGIKIEKKNTDRVTFLGWIPHDKLASYYNACDVVVMPSRWEAFGLVAIEAMKYGRAVIVSDRGALPELIENGKNGFVFKFEEIEQLIGILEKISLDDLRVISSFNEKEFSNKYQDKFVKMSTYQLYQN
ncbi:MAG: glycosyltransferase [Mitsuokella jalaludinii]|nr:glycosyltransferase [Mitsuokella jalaludinii]